MNTHTPTLETTAHAVACDIADQFEHSWNAADGPAYVEPFAGDADYITIQGHHLRGREEIGAGVDYIFATIYNGSTISLRVTEVRCPSPTTIVAQIEHVLDAPTGPLAGINTTIATVVIADTSEGWEVTTLHNTLLIDQTPPE